MALQDFDYVAVTVDDENNNPVDAWLAVPLNNGCPTPNDGNSDTTLIYYTFPDAPAGYQVKNRDCGTVPDDDVTVTANPADFVDTGNPTNPTDPGAAAPNAPTNTIIFTSQSGNDGGPINS